MANNALGSNPPNAVIDITTHTSDWLWAVFVIMLVSDLIFVGWSFSRPLGNRVFHQLPIIILTIATLAYFCMASDLGSTPISTEFARNIPNTMGFANGAGNPTRAIWYVRWIMYAINVPILLLMLLLLSGLPLSEIVTTMFMGLLWAVTFLVGALVFSTYKWGFFVFGCAALLYTVANLFGSGRASARLGTAGAAGRADNGAGTTSRAGTAAGTTSRAGTGTGAAAGSSFFRGAAAISFIWLLYPIAWGVSEGGNVVTPTGEMIFYGSRCLISLPLRFILTIFPVLDIVFFPVFCFLHASTVTRADVTYGLNSGNATIGEKHGGGHGGNGIGNSAAANNGVNTAGNTAV